MRIGKRAGVDWTVGKLLNIILLVLVLVLVIYGISTQSLNPLIENVGGKFNEVLILFNLKDDIYSKDCYSESVVNIGGGKDFLEQVGMSSDVVLNVCKNRMCNISEGGKEIYRVKDGEFEKLENGEWAKYDSVFVGELSSIKFNWEMYNAGVDILSEAKDLYDDGFTKRFVLYGDGGGWSKEVYAVWQNGIWTIKVGDPKPISDGWFKDGKEFMEKGWMVQKWKRRKTTGILFDVEYIKTYITKDDGEAINIFTEIAWRSADDDDKVYWKETIPTKPDEEYFSSSNHGELIRQVAGSGWSFKADDELDIKRLNSLFKDKKEKYLGEVDISVDDLSERIKEKKVTIGKKEFTISVEEDEIFPIVVFTSTSDNEKFGLRHSAYAKINSNLLDGVKLRYFPVVLVKQVGGVWKEIGSEEYYRLPKENFDEVKKATLISEFLKSKCK